MAVSLRLTRRGSKKRPFYRIIAIDSKTKRDGKYIELIGTYNPLTEEINIKEEIALKWLSHGARPTDTVRYLFSKKGIMEKNAKDKQKTKSMNTSRKTATKKVSLKNSPKKVVSKVSVAKSTTKKTTTKEAVEKSVSKSNTSKK